MRQEVCEQRHSNNHEQRTHVLNIYSPIGRCLAMPIKNPPSKACSQGSQESCSAPPSRAVRSAKKIASGSFFPPFMQYQHHRDSNSIPSNQGRPIIFPSPILPWLLLPDFNQVTPWLQVANMLVLRIGPYHWGTWTALDLARTYENDRPV